METVRASELRIGNLVGVSWNNIFSTVIEITTDDVKLKDGFATYNQLQPIPLTEEWLLKFGFERQPWGLVKGGLLFKDNIKYPCEELTLEIGNGFRVTVQYVHQLQNLYFALTGEELLLSLH